MSNSSPNKDEKSLILEKMGQEVNIFIKMQSNFYKYIQMHDAVVDEKLINKQLHAQLEELEDDRSMINSDISDFSDFSDITNEEHQCDILEKAE